MKAFSIFWAYFLDEEKVDAQEVLKYLSSSQEKASPPCSELLFSSPSSTELSLNVFSFFYFSGWLLWLVFHSVLRYKCSVYRLSAWLICVFSSILLFLAEEILPCQQEASVLAKNQQFSVLPSLIFHVSTVTSSLAYRFLLLSSSSLV